MATQVIDPRMELEQHLHMYRQMAKIRAFEEQVNELYKGAKMPGLAHLYVGRGGGGGRRVCGRVPRRLHHRHAPRPWPLPCQGCHDPERMLAEMLGRSSGYCGGKGGSMHIADPDRHPRGQCHRRRQPRYRHRGGARRPAQGSGQVAVCFFGDGAENQGLVMEAMNLAAIWSLP